MAGGIHVHRPGIDPAPPGQNFHLSFKTGAAAGLHRIIGNRLAFCAGMDIPRGDLDIEQFPLVQVCGPSERDSIAESVIGYGIDRDLRFPCRRALGRGEGGGEIRWCDDRGWGGG